jgi:hypothetical protein
MELTSTLLRLVDPAATNRHEHYFLSNQRAVIPKSPTPTYAAEVLKHLLNGSDRPCSIAYSDQISHFDNLQSSSVLGALAVTTPRLNFDLDFVRISISRRKLASPSILITGHGEKMEVPGKGVREFKDSIPMLHEEASAFLQPQP